MTTSPDQGGGAERERLIESHLPLVRAIARRYAGRGETLDDLVQVGAVALIRASDRFDPDRGVSFAAFATPAVEGEIRRHLGDQSGSLRIPRQLRQMTGQLARSRSQLAASLGRVPSVDELATALGVERADVERALEAERARDPFPAGSVDAAEGPDSESLKATDDRLLLETSTQVLDERERQIVFLRFHADLTEREIAEEVGISQAHVSRSLTKALAKLRQELEREPPQTGAGDTTEAAVISAPEVAEQQYLQASAGQSGPAPAPAQTKIGAVGPSEQQARQARATGTEANQEPALPYHVSVKPGEGDQSGGYIASVDELPGSEARGATPVEAVENLRAAMDGWLSAAAEDSRVEPPRRRGGSKGKRAATPSGRFLVRMPSDLHEELTRAAEREQVSLNRFVTAQLAASVSPAASAPLPDAPPPGPADATRASRRNLRMLIAANLAVILLAAAAAITLLVLALGKGL